ncbi:MAG TPA: hypothetical protein VF331_15220 [Polyangiales bacterium]
MLRRLPSLADPWVLCLIASLAVACELRVLALTQPLSDLDATLLPDDAYISLDVARSIGLGLGPRSAGRLTNGVQPLYVLLMAPVYALLGDASLRSLPVQDRGVRSALLLLVLTDLASLCLLVRMLARRWGRSAGVLIAAACWASSPLVVKTALNGLETSLACLASLALLSWHLERGACAPRAPSVAAAWLLGALAGVATLARIDVSIAAGWIALLALWRHPRAWLRLGACSALGFGLIYAPWVGYSLHHTGHWYPISGEATRLQSFPAQLDARFLSHSARVALHAFWRGSQFQVAAAALLLMAVIAKRKARALWGDALAFAPVLLFACSLFVAYAFFQGGWWYFERYLFPAHLVPILLLAASVHVLAAEVKGSRSVLLGSLTLGTLLLGAASLDAWRDVFHHQPRDQGYRAMALWVRDHLPAKTVLGAGQTGALGYFAADHTVVNLDGVVNEDALRAVRAHRLLEYVRDAQVELVIGWHGSFTALSALSGPSAGVRLRLLGQIPGFRTRREAWLVYKVERSL